MLELATYLALVLMLTGLGVLMDQAIAYIVARSGDRS